MVKNEIADLFRCDCPITSAIDVLGDRWMLVIVKQMLLQQKETFKDFTDSDEGIASNILTSKLGKLTALDLISKSQLPNDHKSVYYHLSDAGLSLAPVIVELALWSDSHLRTEHPTMNRSEELNAMKRDKQKFVDSLVQNYRKRLMEFERSKSQ